MNKKITVFVLLPLAFAILVYNASAIFTHLKSSSKGNELHYNAGLDDTTHDILYYDSLVMFKDLRQRQNELLLQKIYEFTTGFSMTIGTQTSFLRFAFPIIGTHDNANYIDEKKRYFVFTYLGLKVGDSNSFEKYIFHTKNDSGFISKLHEIPNQYKGLKKVKYSAFKNVNYIFLPDQSIMSERRNVIVKGGIAIPIKNKFLIRVGSSIVVLMNIFGWYVIAFIVINSIVIIINVSRNMFFNSANNFRLRWIMIACFAMSFFPYLFTLIFYLIYFKDFYPDVSFTHSFWSEDYKWCIAGIVYLLILLAFRKGYKLQQEQDLTV